jgi:hypothetical protein
VLWKQRQLHVFMCLEGGVLARPLERLFALRGRSTVVLLSLVRSTVVLLSLVRSRKRCACVPPSPASRTALHRVPAVCGLHMSIPLARVSAAAPFLRSFALHPTCGGGDGVGDGVRTGGLTSPLALTCVVDTNADSSGSALTHWNDPSRRIADQVASRRATSSPSSSAADVRLLWLPVGSARKSNLNYFQKYDF